MSQGNVDLVRSIYEDWERGDFDSAAWADPGIEYRIPDSPDGAGAGMGKAGMAETHRSFLSAWDGWQIVADSYHEIDADRVIVYFRIKARGKLSGLELGQAWGEAPVCSRSATGN